eukprot:scaffold11387_cov82-Isochrysis_galbana.AAC.1
MSIYGPCLTASRRPTRYGTRSAPPIRPLCWTSEALPGPTRNFNWERARSETDVGNVRHPRLN